MNDWFRPVVIFDDEDEDDLKREFAALWAKYPTFNPNDIGLQLFADRREPMRGLQAAAVWSRELAVIALRDAFALNGGEDLSETDKTQVSREVLSLARTARDPKDRLAAYRLWGDLNGEIAKPGVTINQNDNRVVNVLRVPTRDITPEDDLDFDRRFKTQQLALVAEAKSQRANS